jgi:hypothetical protein
MQDHTLSCSEARGRMAGYLAGEPCPEAAAHLAACEGCFEACLDGILRRPREMPVPEHFRHRLLARLPASTRLDTAEYPWGLVAAAGVVAALGQCLWWSGELPGITSLVTECHGAARDPDRGGGDRDRPVSAVAVACGGGPVRVASDIAG